MKTGCAVLVLMLGLMIAIFGLFPNGEDGRPILLIVIGALLAVGALIAIFGGRPTHCSLCQRPFKRVYYTHVINGAKAHTCPQCNKSLENAYAKQTTRRLGMPSIAELINRAKK